MSLLLIPEAVAQRCSVKKVFLEICQNLQENTCARVYGTGVFLWILWNFWRTQLFIEHLWWLLLLIPLLFMQDLLNMKANAIWSLRHADKSRLLHTQKTVMLLFWFRVKWHAWTLQKSILFVLLDLFFSKAKNIFIVKVYLIKKQFKSNFTCNRNRYKILSVLVLLIDLPSFYSKGYSSVLYSVWHAFLEITWVRYIHSPNSKDIMIQFY